MSAGKKNKTHLTWQTIAITLLSSALTITLVLLVRDSYALQRAGTFERFPHSWQLPVKISADEIQPWMTFDYLNKQFGLPSEYLKTALQVTDPKYPNVPIGKMFRRQGADTQAVVERVKQLVREHNT